MRVATTIKVVEVKQEATDSFGARWFVDRATATFSEDGLVGNLTLIGGTAGSGWYEQDINDVPPSGEESGIVELRRQVLEFLATGIDPTVEDTSEEE